MVLPNHLERIFQVHGVLSIFDSKVVGFEEDHSSKIESSIRFFFPLMDRLLLVLSFVRSEDAGHHQGIVEQKEPSFDDATRRCHHLQRPFSNKYPIRFN